MSRSINAIMAENGLVDNFITLEIEEKTWQYGCMVGAARQWFAKDHHEGQNLPRADNEEHGWDIAINGALGEACVAQWLGYLEEWFQYQQENPGRTDLKDIVSPTGRELEVRHKAKPHLKLLLKRGRDYPGQTCVSVCVQPLERKCILCGVKTILPEHLEADDMDLPRPCPSIPQNALLQTWDKLREWFYASNA